MNNWSEVLASLDPNIAAAVAFVAIACMMYLVGRLLIGVGRNRIGLQGRPLVFGILTRPLALLVPMFGDTRRQVKADLKRAGYYHPQALDEYAAIRNTLVLGWLGVIALAYWLVVRQDPTLVIAWIVAAVIMTLLFYSVPRLILQAQAASRLDRIQSSLPDALDMITMTMTGGLPLIRSLEVVCSELETAHPDIACELTIVARHTEAGSLEKALQQFANRIDIPDVQSLTAIVGQTERLGANVAAAFQDFADGIRRSMRQRAEERGNKASVKLLLPVVFCLAPPIYILLLSPALLELRNFVLNENRPGGLLSQDTISDSSEPLTSQPSTTNDFFIPRTIPNADSRASGR